MTGPLGAPDNCRCTLCRKQTGRYLASTDVPRTALAVTGAVTGFQSSPKVRRGFCAACGSTLFWDPVFRDWIGVATGAFDGPTGWRWHELSLSRNRATGVTLARHILVAHKGEYYTVADGLPQNPQ